MWRRLLSNRASNFLISVKIHSKGGILPGKIPPFAFVWLFFKKFGCAYGTAEGNLRRGKILRSTGQYFKMSPRLKILIGILFATLFAAIAVSAVVAVSVFAKASASNRDLAEVSGLKASKITDDSASFSWKAVSGALGYAVYIDGELDSVATTTKFTEEPILMPGTEYTYTVVPLSDLK